MSWHKPGARAVADFAGFDDKGLWGDNAIDYSLAGIGQATKVQAILDEAATLGVSLRLAGDISLEQPLVMPSTPVPIWGIGLSVCAFKMLVDYGPGSHAIFLRQIDNDLRDFSIIGPGGPIAKDGTMIAHMGGLFTQAGGQLEMLAISGFGYGLGGINDHYRHRLLDMRGNTHACNLLDNPAGGLGDQLWDSCYFTSVNRASIAIADTNEIANARFIQGHSGGPFVFWRYPAGTLNADCAAGDTTMTIYTPPWFPDMALCVGKQILDSPHYTFMAADTTVVSATQTGTWPNGGKTWTLELSDPVVRQITHAFFPDGIHYAATGVSGQSTLTGVNLPDIFEMGSLDLGVTIVGPGIPANTTVSSHTGATGNWTLTLSQPLTGDVFGISFAPRGGSLSGVVFDNFSMEFPGHAIHMDDGRNWAEINNVVIDSPGEFGTGTGAAWPGKANPSPGKGGDHVGNWTVGQMTGQRWRAAEIVPNGRDNQPYIYANQVYDTHVDDVKAPGTAPHVVHLRSGDGTGQAPFEILGFTSGRREMMPGGAQTGWLLADENCVQGQLLETVSYNQVRPWRGGQIAGFATHNVTAGDTLSGGTVMLIMQYDNTSAKVINTSAATIANNALVKPDPAALTNSAKWGGVVAANGITAASYSDGFDRPTLGRVNDGAISAGTLGRVMISVPA